MTHLFLITENELHGKVTEHMIIVRHGSMTRDSHLCQNMDRAPAVQETDEVYLW